MPPTFTSGNDDHAAALARAQVQAHVALARLGVAGGVLGALFIAYVQADELPAAPILTWLTCLVPVHTLRLALYRAHRLDPARLPDRMWLAAFRAAFALHGVVWGLASVLLFPAGNVAHQAFLVFAVGGVTATACTLTAFDLAAPMWLLATSMTPLVWRLLGEGGHILGTMALSVLVFTGVLVLTAVRAHRDFLASVTQRRLDAGRAEALSRFQQALAHLRGDGDTDPAQFVVAAAAETAAALHLTRAVIWLCGTDGPDTDIARIRAVAGPAAGRGGDPGPLRLSEHPAYAVRAAEGTALVRDAAREDPGFAELTGTPFLPAAVQARLDLPMLVSGRLEGLLWCEREHGQPWTADEEAFVAAVAAKVLASLQHWRQREAERQLRELNLHLEDLVAARTRELSTSEARLAEALDATNDGLWEFDLASGSVYFSPVWARLLGYAPDEVRPHVDFFWQTVHPDDIARLQAVVTDHLEGRRPSKELEVRLRTKGGEYRWFLDQGRVVQRAADGTPQRMVGTISDITERKRALQDLRDSEERFRAVFDKSPVIVALVRMADGRIAEMNEAGLQAFGYSRAEMIGRTTFELDLWVNETQRRASAGLLIHEGVVSGFELQFRRKNGEQFWGLLSSSQITLNGEPYSLNTVQDITARRELEARFLQSQKMEVVGHLAGGIAHDFNNVLTVITGTAELAMAGTSADDPMHEALATIRDASARAAGLTGQLMAFSRRQILQPVALDLNDVVAGLEAMLRRVLGALVNLTITPAARPAMVVADRGSLEQVVLNLAINARDAMPNGGDLRIDVALATIHAGQHDTRHTLRPGPYVTVTVADTGTGMSDAVAQRIFEPFFTTKAVGKGTGLGLSMAHGVVSQSGGDIVVRSAVGAGSSFTIYLPWVEHAVAASALPAGAPAGGHETILVVDDNREIREVVRRVLSFSGYHVLTAEHGEDALRVLAEHGGRVALLLTDVVMPGLNGRELAARVHASFPHVRVLFTSGYADDAIAHHGVLAKGVEFIAKPYSLQALARKVRDVLDAPV